MSTVNVGARLQAVRKLKGLSQRELAKRVGVTNSTISLIEQNRVSPSISSLTKVLDGIPMSLAEFFTFELEAEQAGRIFYSAQEMPDLGQLPIHSFLIGSDYPNRQLTLLREVIPVGEVLDTPPIRHEGDTGGVVIQGELELTVGEQQRVLHPGDGYYFDGRRPHRRRNVGTQAVVLISVQAPSPT